MSNIMQDLTGLTFGKLHVIKYDNNGKWICKCECGNIKTYRTYTLTHGDAKSCGCNKIKGQLDDLTGKQFGRWKVIKYAGKSKWRCQCSCCANTIRDVRGADLKAGRSASCGCIKREKASIIGNTYGDITITGYNTDTYQFKYRCNKCGYVGEAYKYDILYRSDNKCRHVTRISEDLTGRQFGNWTVIKYKGNYKWECKCNCNRGTIHDVSRYDLITGRSTNCGCKRLKYDLTDKTFGRLKVIRYLGNQLWECRCLCGNTVNVLSTNLLSGGTKSCGCLKNESTYSRDEIIDIINRFIEIHNELPYLDDLADVLKLHKYNVKHSIDKYDLWDYINKTFRSKPERDIASIISSTGVSVLTSVRNVLSKSRELDIYIPSKRIAIEFNGNYWHSEEKVDNSYHLSKSLECLSKNIRLIHIFEYEWNNNRDKLERFIKNTVSNNKQIIYARKTVVKDISYADAEDFENKYHLQGSVKSSINLGITLNNELLGIMTFSTPRFNNNFQYELIRLCYKDNISIVGGTEKLFQYFLNTYKPYSIITYSDFAKYTGIVYKKLGFSTSRDNITKPNYVWYNKSTDTILKRYETQKHKLLELGVGTDEQTEDEIMHSLGYIKIYDCGNLRYEWYTTF